MTPPAIPATPVVFYDGVCGLCDRLVTFLIARDRARVFRYAALQSDYAARVLAAHGRSTADLDTMMVLTGEGRVVDRSHAIFYVLSRLGPGWRLLALGRLLPRFLTDWAYRQIARRRLKFFGQLDTCRLPTPAERELFLA